MLVAEQPALHGERLATVRFSPQIAAIGRHATEVVQGLADVRVVGAEQLALHGQGFEIAALGELEFALAGMHQRRGVQYMGDLRVVFAEGGARRHQRLLQQPLGRVGVALSPEQHAQQPEAARHELVLLTQVLPLDLERPAEVLLGDLVFTDLLH